MTSEKDACVGQLLASHDSNRTLTGQEGNAVIWLELAYQLIALRIVV